MKSLNQEFLSDVQRLINYCAADEANSYEEDPSEAHIYNTIVGIQTFLDKYNNQ